MAPCSWSPAVVSSARQGARAQRSRSLLPARAVLAWWYPPAEHPPCTAGERSRSRTGKGMGQGPVPRGCRVLAASGNTSHTSPNTSTHLGGCSSSFSPSLTGGEQAPQGRVPRDPFPPAHAVQSPTTPPSPLCSFLFLCFYFCFHHDVPSLSPLRMPPPSLFYLWIPKKIRLSLITCLFVGGVSKLCLKAVLAQMLLRAGFLLGYTCLLLVH